MATISDIVDILRNRFVPIADPTIMLWPRAGGGSVKIQRTLWLLVDADGVGLVARDGSAFIASIIARAELELAGTDAALPSAEELDGPGAWRAGLARAVRIVKRPAAVLWVSLAGEPDWRRWIIEAILGELALTDAVVIRAA